MDIDSFSVGPLDSIFYIPSFLTSSEQAYFLHQVNNAPASKWKSLTNRRLQNWVPPWLTILTKRIFTETALFPSPINHVLVNEYEPGQGIMPHQDGPLYFPVVAIVSLGSPTLMRFVPHQSIVEAKEEIRPTPTGKGGEVAGDLTDAQDGANHSIDQCMSNQEDSGAREHERPCNLPAQQCQQRTFPKDVAVILMPGSLLLFKDSAYKEYLHGIEDTIEHKLGASVVNAQMVMDGENGGTFRTMRKEHGILNVSDSPESCTLQRTGTRISLTCRLVPKVQGKFLRL